MASIHKDPRGKSPFWYCAYRLPNGKRTFRSTKMTDRRAAEEFCRRLEYASHESKSGRLIEMRARELISEIVEQATGEPLRNYTAEEWLLEWLQGKKATKAEGTFLKYENAINGFIASVGNRAKLNVNQIAPRDVLRWRDAQILDGKSPSTANDHVKIARMAFTSARRQGFITHNPAEAVDMLPEDTDPARQPFTIEQVQAILRAAKGDWRGAIMIALYTGARLQDVANMRWESVDLQNKWIAFKVGKTKQRIKLPMHEALHEFLLELPAPDNGKAFLFPFLAGKGTGGKSGLSMAFARIMEKARVRGEVVRERQGQKGRSVNSLSFHSFRHTLTSIMANAGVPVEVRQKFTGHASAEMNQHYTHHEIATLRAAVEKVPSVKVRALMAKRVAKRQRAVKESRINKRATRKAKAGKRNHDLFRLFSQINRQYEIAEPSTICGLRRLCMYSGFIQAVGNAATKKANKSMSGEERAKLYEQTVKRLHAAGSALTVWWRKAGYTRLKPELTKAQSRQGAEIAAHDVKASASLISLSALEGDERFFIYLGKYLSGEMNSTFPDKLDFYVWHILRRNPSIKSPDAVRELKKHGFTMTEEAFRMRKKRFGFAKFKRFSRDSRLRKV